MVSQSYCKIGGGHRNQLAYDFMIPIGADITAARAGRVLLIYDYYPDTGMATAYGAHNYIFIQHEDGTVAFYAHLMQDSIIVRVGDTVEQGQLIAKSGNSGMTGNLPHLHFGVYASYPPEEGNDVPIVFKNVDGDLDKRGGLRFGHYYEALPYD